MVVKITLLPLSSSSEMNILMVIGISIVFGFIGGFLSKKVKVPEVVGMILTGVLLGESILGFITNVFINGTKPLVDLALAFIGMGIGTELKLDAMKNLKKSIFAILFLESFGAFTLVALGVFILTHELYIALIFGALAISTAPAATADVLWEYEAKGDLTTTIFSIIALDDIVAIIVYAFAFSYAESVIVSEQTFLLKILLDSLIHIFGSIILGAIVGVILIFLSRKIESVNKLVGIIFIGVLTSSGVAETMGFSLILTNVIAGIIITNFSKISEEIFVTVREIVHPLIVLFFVLIGSMLKLELVFHMGLIGIIYLIMRFAGKFSGATLGGYVSNSSTGVKKYLGLCLLSQAGVAVGLATSLYYNLITLNGVGPHLGTLILNTIISTTLIVQILGPPLIKYAVTKSGEVHKPSQPKIIDICLRSNKKIKLNDSFKRFTTK